MLISLDQNQKHEHEEGGGAHDAVPCGGYLMWLEHSQALTCGSLDLSCALQRFRMHRAA